MITDAQLDSYVSDVALKDGSTVHIRPIRPEDLEGMLALWERLSPETIRLRFFAPTTMDAGRIRYFTELDYQQRFALVAELGGRLIGVARFDRLAEDPQAAEFAVLVEDAHQGRGIGTALLRALMTPARDLGIQQFHGEVLAENTSMLRVIRDAGYEPLMRSLGSIISTSFSTEPTEAFLRSAHAAEARSAIAALRKVFEPSSVAVIGASRDPASIGGVIFRHLLAGGFAGPVYPINRHAGSVQSVAAYPDVASCPTVPELVIVCVPADDVVAVVDEAGACGVGAAVIISAGFAEGGPEGKARQTAVVEVARRHGLRIVGPNCMGVVHAADTVRLNASLSPVMPRTGGVAFSSQSGALGLTVLAVVDRLGLGLSSFASIGNKADISGNDLLQHWEADEATDVILVYLESFGNPRKFARIARQVGRTKPIVAVKGGRSPGGVRGAESRTGFAAAGEQAADALFRQTGVVRVDTLEEMFHVAMVASTQPLLRGHRVGILTNGGGPGVLAADACEAYGLEVPVLSDLTQDRLAGFLQNAGLCNPVDMVADSGALDYGRALEVLASSGEVDAVLVVFVPPVQTDSGRVATELARRTPDLGVPVLTVFMTADGTPCELLGAGIPNFQFPESAARALGHVAAYSAWRARPLGRIVQVEGADVERARQIVRDGAGELAPDAVAQLLGTFGIRLAAGEHPAPEGSIDGLEMIAGMRLDPTFGPVMHVGMGGMLVELGDVALRIHPLTDTDADDMVANLRGARLLDGYRGSPPVDVPALKRLLLRLSALVEAVPDVAEIDLDPIFVRRRGVQVLGARVRLVVTA